MEKRPNYKEVKNHIHNTLGITKEDIKQIVGEQVREEVNKLVKSEEILHRIDYMVKLGLKEALGSGYEARKSIAERVENIVKVELAKMVVNRLDLSVDVNLKGDVDNENNN